ncbi:MAG: hypothetical protein R2710_15745 [Acidimicrobiales bacterium]
MLSTSLGDVLGASSPPTPAPMAVEITNDDEGLISHDRKRRYPDRRVRRPGCPFCMLLERSLKKKRIPFTKKNIWDDAAHAAVVRSLANGTRPCPPSSSVAGSVNPLAKDVVAAI